MVEADTTPLTPLLRFFNHDESRGLPPSNEGMVRELVLSGALHSPCCVGAFEAVDRRAFWPTESGHLAYADMPLRNGRLHLSAPHIYAKALESLMPLTKGLSFLNVGSGTGYFNSVVSELVGEMATNHGIDIWEETVAHAKSCCGSLGKPGIEFRLGNVYQLNIHQTMRYDRIYLGACANSRSKYLYRLLEVGGILIGPFQVGSSQQLRRVVRQSETVFHVEVLGSVQFAPLQEPVPRRRLHVPSDASDSGACTPRDAGEDASQPVGLPGVPFTFSLAEQPWSPARCWLYPSCYRRTVAATSLLCRPRDSTLPSLPPEVWIKHIFPWCPRWWFDPAPLLVKRSSRCLESRDDCDHSDDSTCAASSALPSVQTTPECGPSQPPAGLDSDSESEAGDVCFEVFGDGQRHAIGAEHDPDDDDSDDGQLAVPLHLLQLLAEGARRHGMDSSSSEDDETLQEEEESASEDGDLGEQAEPEEEEGPDMDVDAGDHADEDGML